MNIADKMRDRRLALGLTADEVAEAVGVSRSNIYRYESGDIKKMPIDIIEPLSKVLRTTPQDLMGWKAVEEIEIIYKRLDQDNKKRLYEYALDLFKEQVEK